MDITIIIYGYLDGFGADLSCVSKFEGGESWYFIENLHFHHFGKIKIEITTAKNPMNSNPVATATYPHHLRFSAPLSAVLSLGIALKWAWNQLEGSSSSSSLTKNLSYKICISASKSE